MCGGRIVHLFILSYAMAVKVKGEAGHLNLKVGAENSMKLIL